MKNYDKKVKQTRILLSDYLALKQISQLAGISMAEALHKLITKEPLEAPIHPAQILMPVTMAQSIPVTTAYRATPITAIATNGDKGVSFRIRPRGARYA